MNHWFVFGIGNSFTALGSSDMHLGCVDTGSLMAFGTSYFVPVWRFFVSGMGHALCILNSGPVANCK